MGDTWDGYDPEAEFRARMAERRVLDDPKRQERIVKVIQRVLGMYRELSLTEFRRMVCAVYALEHNGAGITHDEAMAYAHGRGGVCWTEHFRVRLVNASSRRPRPLPAFAQDLDDKLALLAKSKSVEVREAVWLLRHILPFHLTP